MPNLRLLFLVTVLVVTSGYRFRCWWACTDQTAIQHDYVEQRDHCRSYAQLKLDMVVRNSPHQDAMSRKTHLVNLFSECMARKGWDIPSGKIDDNGDPILDQAATAGPPKTREEKIEDAQQQKWSLSRTSECAFARHAAPNSKVAAARAEACDLECAQRTKNAPDAPRPAACPAGPDPSLARGVEREYDPIN